jgi:hypothetical protein
VLKVASEGVLCGAETAEVRRVSGWLSAPVSNFCTGHDKTTSGRRERCRVTLGGCSAAAGG